MEVVVVAIVDGDGILLVDLEIKLLIVLLLLSFILDQTSETVDDVEEINADSNKISLEISLCFCFDKLSYEEKYTYKENIRLKYYKLY